MTCMTVLHESRRSSAVAAQLDTTEEEVRAALERAKKRLFDVREKRPQAVPRREDPHELERAHDRRDGRGGRGRCASRR